MKRCIALLILLQVTLVAFAASYITGIPANQVRDQFLGTDLNGSLRLLSQSGYQILHYNDVYAIAITPATEKYSFPGSVRLADFPSPRKLYLVGKLDRESAPDMNGSGEILLDLGSAVLLASDLDEIGLRAAIRNPLSRLEMEPIRFPDTTVPLNVSQDTRTDIVQLLSFVNTASVQTRITSLQDFQTRYALADNRLAVAEWIRAQYLSYGITDAQLQPFTWQNTTQYNVVATITGTVYPDQFIIVGGHHDSISSNSDPMITAPGADDNASGTVAALEMARVMMAAGYQPKTSIRFVTFAAEEFGLWGAKHYSEDALQNGQNIRLMINHDMIANNNDAPANWSVRLMPYDGSMDHSSYALQVTEQYTSLDAWYGSMNSGSSDSHPFWQRGYNVIYFFESDFSQVYHSDQDIVANLDPVYCTEVIKASVACAATFADMPAAPYDLVIRDNGDGSSLVAQWEGYNDPTIAYYNVYHSTTLGNWGTPATTSNTTCLVSGLTQGQLYYFAVSAVDTFGNESYMVYATGIPLSVPLQPQNFTDSPVFQAITLNWDANSELDLAGYQLYRSQIYGELGTQIGGGTITANSYLDTDVQGSQDYYYYSLRAIDNGGNASSFTQVVKSRPVTLDQGILVVDETENMGGTNPFQPNDAQVDDFYAILTEGFETSSLDLDDLDENLRLADIGIYSSILWHGNDFANMDYPYAVREVLDQYIQLGGNVMFSVYVPSMAFALNASYPMMFGEDDFIYDAIGIGEVAYDSQARFRFADPVHDQFPTVQIDPLKTSPSLSGHIIRVESIGPRPGCATVYNYGSDYADDTPQGSMNDMPVGILNQLNSGSVVVVSFPLYNLYQNHAQDLVEYVFTEYFNETISPADDPQAAVPSLSISSGQPNPFRDKTSVRVDRNQIGQPLRVEVYNLRGQLVRHLFAGPGPRSLLLEWDGLDDKGASVSSGVYFMRASQNGSSVQKRIARLK